MVQTPENTLIEQLHTMKQRMEVLFSESFKVERVDADVRNADAQAVSWEPLMDIWETADEWFLAADLPGVPDEDLHVELAEKYLTVRGKRTTSGGPEAMKAVRRERPAGTFSRTFALPEDAQEDSVKAELRHGVLTVIVSKPSGPQPTSQKVPVITG